MNYPTDGMTPEVMRSLTLPAGFDEVAQETALGIDAFLAQEERPVAMLDTKVAAHREVGQSHLFTFHGKHTLDFNRFRWPSFLYIPKGAKSRDYWIGDNAPDDHRYALEWTAPATATANKASRQDGTLFSFGQLLNEKAGSSLSTEAGIGILYNPPMSLGVIYLQPQVDCSGTVRTFLEHFPTLAAGHVEVKAQLILAAWQQIPTGFDLLGFKTFDVATSGRRDQSFGPELINFQKSFDSSTLSAPFVVQHGRTYLLGVVGRISIASTLTTNSGGPLPPISNHMLRVWGSMNCVVSEIDVFTKRIDIP